MRSNITTLLTAALLAGATSCDRGPASDASAGSDAEIAEEQERDLSRLGTSDVERVELWVALTGADAVAVLDAETGRELARVPVGQRPTYVKVSPDGRWVAVANSASSTATLIDAERRSVVRVLETGTTPKGLNWSPDSRRLWVVNEGAEPGSVWVYAAPDFERIASIPVGRAPHNVVVSPDGRRAFVTGTASGSVHVIAADDLAVVDSIGVEGAAHNLTLAPDGGRLYVTLTDRNRVAMVSTRTGEVLGSIAVVVGHHVPAVNGAGYLAAGGFGSGAVSVVRLGRDGTPTESRQVALAPGAHGVAFAPGGRLFATVLTGDYVAEIDPAEALLARKLPVPGGPFTLSVRVVRGDGTTLGPGSGTAS